MTIGELFLHTFGDLDERVPLGRGEYDALMTAWLLRKLLLDELPLAALANRPPSRRIKIEHEFVDEQPPPDAHGWLPNGTLYPGDSNGAATVLLSRDAFLAWPILVAFGETITVRELIKFTASVQGAIHVSRPRTRKDETFWDFMWGTKLILPHASPQEEFTTSSRSGRSSSKPSLLFENSSSVRPGLPHLPEFAKGQQGIAEPSTRGW